MIKPRRRYTHYKSIDLKALLEDDVEDSKNEFVGEIQPIIGGWVNVDENVLWSSRVEATDPAIIDGVTMNVHQIVLTVAHPYNTTTGIPSTLPIFDVGVSIGSATSAAAATSTNAQKEDGDFEEDIYDELRPYETKTSSEEGAVLLEEGNDVFYEESATPVPELYHIGEQIVYYRQYPGETIKTRTFCIVVDYFLKPSRSEWLAKNLTMIHEFYDDINKFDCIRLPRFYRIPKDRVIIYGQDLNGRKPPIRPDFEQIFGDQIIPPPPTTTRKPTKKKTCFLRSLINIFLFRF